MSSRSSRLVIELLGQPLGIVEPKSVPAAIANWYPFFRANWRSDLSYTHSWFTDIIASKEEKIEERIGLWDRPIRQYTSELTGLRGNETSRLQNFLMRIGTNPIPMPIHQDRIKVEADSNGTTLYCTTQYRHFFVGQRIALVPSNFGVWSGGGNCIFAIIDSIEVDRLVLQSSLPFTIPTLTFIYPMIDAITVERSSGSLINANMGTYSIAVEEGNSLATLPASWEGECEFLCDYYQGYPILGFRPNFIRNMSQEVVRSLQRIRSGRSVHIDPDGNRPNFAFTLDISSFNREEAWNVERFFDSRRGRLHPYFLLSPINHFTPLTVGTTTLTFTMDGRIEDAEDFFTHIGFEYEDGSRAVRAINSITSNSINYDSVPNSNLKRITCAFFGRFQSDILRQSWTTDETCNSQFTFTEIKAE